ncbi:hypothetical protein [Paenibacillus pini]|uniref:Uncharacterized protein n=1 Tax=Paenibacillus pini JCM 16418 TaxID=1236976 RepID=W7YM11_9BACL|nr:hypothetical protein [Paenibacillus pini]GAF08593.1 hypothetical protein JCM16418_2677 [Paenibacillus pini JCM 16418]
MTKQIVAHFVRSFFISLLIFCGFLWLPASSVQANYFQDFYKGIEQFSDLPSQVNQLKENYQQTVDELNKAQANIKAYQDQNAQLIEQNRQLASTVQQLKESNDAKTSSYHKLKVICITVLLLTIGYFVLIRILRYTMRRSNRR